MKTGNWPPSWLQLILPLFSNFLPSYVFCNSGTLSWHQFTPILCQCYFHCLDIYVTPLLSVAVKTLEPRITAVAKNRCWSLPLNHQLQWLQGLKIDSGLLDLAVTPFLLAIRNPKIDGKVVKLEILWMGLRNPNHQLIDGKHPMIFFGFQPFKIGGSSDFATIPGWHSPLKRGSPPVERSTAPPTTKFFTVVNSSMCKCSCILASYKRKETESWRALGTFFPIFGDIFFGKNLCGDIFQKHHK